MARINDILDIMRKVFPEENIYKEDDNVGLLIGSEKGETEIVLCCLDVTSEIINEAVNVGAKLIISHHPFIYTPINSVTDDDPKGQMIIQLIKNDISVYSAHTNMDYSYDGINRYVAEKLGLENQKTIDDYIDNEQGFGIIGKFPKKIWATQFLEKVKELGDYRAGLYAKKDKEIQNIAIINGGGGSNVEYIDIAIYNGADCLVTGDIKHHVALYAYQKDFCLIDIQHYACEAVFLPRLCEILNNKGKENNLSFKAIIPKSERNPLLQ